MLLLVYIFVIFLELSENFRRKLLWILSNWFICTHFSECRRHLHLLHISEFSFRNKLCQKYFEIFTKNSRHQRLFHSHYLIACVILQRMSEGNGEKKRKNMYCVHIMYSSGNGNMKPNSTLLRFNCSKRLSISTYTNANTYVILKRQWKKSHAHKHAQAHTHHTPNTAHSTHKKLFALHVKRWNSWICYLSLW